MLLIFPLLILCSPAIAAAASHSKVKSEQLLPVSAMGIIAILYISYILNELIIGFAVAVLIGCGFYLFTIVQIVKRPRKIISAATDFIKNFFRPEWSFLSFVSYSFISQQEAAKHIFGMNCGYGVRIPKHYTTQGSFRWGLEAG